MEAQIIAALKKLGHAVSPGALADHMEVDAGSHGFRLALKAVLDAGTAVAQGKTSGRRIALPGMKFDAPDASARKPKKHTKAKGGHKKKRRATATRTPAAPIERFIPTVDASSRLVIVNGAEPLIFNDEQTEAIATLLFQHYDPKG
jgi:hypothetical protein